MIILIEGIDKAGKSSLISGLSRLIPATIYKNTIKPDNTLASGQQTIGIYRGLYNYALERPDTFHIFDRSHITELVYGAVLRNYKPALLFDWERFEYQHRDRMLLMKMSTNVETIIKRFETEKEDFLREHHIQPILAKYKSVVYNSCLRKVYIDGDVSRAAVVKQAYDFIYKNSKLL